MHKAILSLKSMSPYCQNRHVTEEKLDRELPDAYERRTWRKRLHVNSDGKVFIPPMCFQRCLAECAKFLSIQIPGKGKATYTKHFEAGIMITEPLVLPITPEEVEPEELFLPADGVRGSGRRVMKLMPRINSWSGDVTVYILDEIITREVLFQHAVQAGSLIGIGNFRPRNMGYWGRFQVRSVTWERDN